MRYAALLLFFWVTQTHALLYEWSGNCTEACVGVAHATFTVDDSYSPGTAWNCTGVGPCIIQKIDYSDNLRQTSWHPSVFAEGWGRFPNGASDAGFMIFGLSDIFDAPFWSGAFPGVEDPQGAWTIGDPSSRGTGGRFSLVPEPATLLLLIVAMLGFIAPSRFRPHSPVHRA